MPQTPILNTSKMLSLIPMRMMPSLSSFFRQKPIPGANRAGMVMELRIRIPTSITTRIGLISPLKPSAALAASVNRMTATTSTAASNIPGNSLGKSPIVQPRKRRSRVFGLRFGFVCCGFDFM